MSQTKFYVNIPQDGYNLDAYKDAIRFAMTLAEECNDYNRIVLYIATKDNVSFFDELFDKESIESLRKEMINCEGILYCIRTKQTYSSDHSVQFNDILVSFGMDAEDLFELDDVIGVKCIIAIPWLKDKIHPWVQRWDATEINGNPIPTAPMPILPPVVRVALDNLTECIGLYNNTLHDLDDEFLKTTIRTLHKYASPLDSFAIDSYLVAEKKWPSKHSQYLVSLLKRLDEGRSFKGGKKTGLKQIFQNWINQIPQN